MATSKPTTKYPKVSIVLPTYNRAHLITRAIDSVLNQNYTNFELLIIDNFSTDNTFELIKNYREKKIKYFRFKNNNIIAKSRNYGIAKSKGEYIAFLDSDDWWHKNKLEISMRYLKKGYDLTYHNLQIFNKLKKEIIKRNCISWQLKSPFFKNMIDNGNPISNSSVVVKKSLINKINGFSEDFKLIGSEDFDAWLRCSNYSNKFKFINKVLGYYFIGNDATTSIRTDISSILYLQAKYLKHLKITNKKFPSWLKYKLLVAFFRKKRFKISLLLSSQILLKPYRFNIFIKSLFIYFVSLASYKFKL